MMRTTRNLIHAAVLLLALSCWSEAASAQIALQVQRTLSGSVATGSNVIFDSTIYSAGNVSYNSATGVVTFNQAGRYLINHWTAFQFVDTSTGAVNTAISSSQGDFISAGSTSPSGQVVGVGIVDVVAAPVTMSLVNSSTGALHLAGSVGTTASLVITEQLPPATPAP